MNLFTKWINRDVLCLLLIAIITSSNVCFSQEKQKEVLISGSFTDISLITFLDYISNEHQLDVYYKSEWLDSIAIDVSFKNEPIKEALNKILSPNKIQFEIFQESSIVLFPGKSLVNSLIYDDEYKILVIGDNRNEGKYRNAIIKGEVIDGKTGEKLPGAVILDRHTNMAISTSQNGHFEFDIATGNHEFQISFMGYEHQNQKIKLIEDGSVTFELFEESHNIAEVTIMGTEKEGSRTQMSIVKVESKMIKELPVLMGEADLVKSLVMMPGIQSVGELSSGFNVRGGNTDQNLILVDGTPVYNTSHLFGFFSMINPDAIEDVVIYKGGVPASYGERLSSVMDLALKDGNTEALKLYGGVGLVNSRITLEGPLGKEKKSSFILGGRSTYSDWIFNQIKDAEIKNSRATFYDLNGKLNFNLGEKGQISIMGYRSADEFKFDSNTLYEYANTLSSLRWNHNFSKRLKSESTLSYSNYQFKMTEESDFGEELDYKLLTAIKSLGFKYTLSYNFKSNVRLEGGIQGNGYWINPGQINPSANTSKITAEKVDEEQAREFAGFISSDFNVSERLILSLGLRFSHFLKLGESLVYLYKEGETKSKENVLETISFEKNETVKKYSNLEPRLSLKYSLSSKNSIRWSYQRISQYLNQLSNTSVVSPADFWKVSDYHVKPLIADQVAIGCFHSNDINGFEASTEIYYKKLQNLLEYKNGASLVMNRAIERDLIQADGYAYGVELFLKKNTGKLNGMVSYSYSRTKRKTDQIIDEETINDGRYYPSVYDKPHDLSIIANYQISRRWRLSGNFVFSSGRPVTLPELKYKYGDQQVVYYSDRNKYRMPSYHRFDLSITFDENLKKKRMWKGSWTLSVYNLYGRSNPYSVFYQRDSEKNPKAKMFGLYKFSVIGVPVPSLTYNFIF